MQGTNGGGLRPSPPSLIDMQTSEILNAREAEHRAEVGKLGMQLALYRQALEEHGIEPPDRDGAELLQLWRDSAAVITTASEFTARLSSAAELMATTWRTD